MECEERGNKGQWVFNFLWGGLIYFFFFLENLSVSICFKLAKCFFFYARGEDELCVKFVVQNLGGK